MLLDLITSLSSNSYFDAKGKFIKIEHTREQMINSGVPFESVQLTAFGQ
jgi:hypothetical protein